MATDEEVPTTPPVPPPLVPPPDNAREEDQWQYIKARTAQDPNTSFGITINRADGSRYYQEFLGGKAINNIEEEGSNLRNLQAGKFAGKLEEESYNERSGLPTTGTPTRVTGGYFDNARGVLVAAPIGKKFQLYEGGGVKLVDGSITGADHQADSTRTQNTSLFDQPTVGGKPTPNFKQEQLAYQGAGGKKITRTGQTFFDPERGIDVTAQPGNVLIQYEDGTIEERPYGAQPGEAKQMSEFGPSKEELGIKPPKDPNAEQGGMNGLARTSELELIGKEYTVTEGPDKGKRRVAPQGQSYFQDPKSRKILLRPDSQAQYGQESTSPSILAEREQQQTQPSIEQLLGNYDIDLGDGAFLEGFKSDPIGSFEDVFSNLLDKMGVGSIRSEITALSDEMKKLDDGYAKQVADVNGNPWLSEGDRADRIKLLDAKYQTQKGQLTDRLNLFNEVDQRAREEARFISTTALNQYNQNRQFQMEQLQMAETRANNRISNQIKLAGMQQDKEKFEFEKQQYAQELLSESMDQSYKGVKEVQGGLFDLASGQWIVGPKASGGGSGGGTANERLLARIGAASPAIMGALNQSRGNDGYADPGMYTEIRQQAAAGGIDASSFDNYFSSAISPQERTRLFGDPYRMNQVFSQQDPLDSVIDEMIRNYQPR